ncbi:MAG: polymer-forming cytoskeletal protein [Nitrospirota bacterium]|jgi:cytoskeletal protein CcmA (bactofilin family)
MFSKAEKYRDGSSRTRDKELSDPFASSQPDTAHTHSPMCLGKTVVIKGELTATEDLVIFGRVEGTITVKDHVVTIGQGAIIEAEVTAHGVVVEGHVAGNIEATEHLEIRPGGMVIGDVRMACLVIRDGATLKGRVDMDADRSNLVPKPRKSAGSPPAGDKSSPPKRDGEKVQAT